MPYIFYLYVLLKGLFFTQVYVITIGDTPVEIIQQTGKGKTFIHLHENETTALQAAKLYVDYNGGTLITIRQHGERNIVFYLHKIRYEFDPNRIFTDKGIHDSLKLYGPYSLQAHKAVKKFANKIRSLLPPGPVIAVHNNRGYSIREYFPEHPLQADASALHYLDDSNYRNFYFVTRQLTFDKLKNLSFNVALQAKKPNDDGSLSFALSKKNYINIEAAYGELNMQIKMLYMAAKVA